MSVKITDHLTGLTYTGENVRETLYDFIDLNEFASPLVRETVADAIERLDYEFLEVSAEWVDNP